jgi:putative membrane protein
VTDNEIITNLPHFHVSLNASVAAIISLGYYFIKKDNPYAHRNCMIAAMTISVVFLISYLTYHANVGYVPFKGQGIVRPFYFTLLASHVILAALFVPIILVTATRAISGDYYKHSLIARWALPIWLYVSVTGVLIYILVFHVYTA